MFVSAIHESYPFVKFGTTSVCGKGAITHLWMQNGELAYVLGISVMELAIIIRM